MLREVLMSGPVDPLADILRYIRISSAIFLRGDFREPWAFRSCTADELVSVLELEAAHPILFHIVQKGVCHVALDTGEFATARAGEALVLPYSNVHRMGYPPGTDPAPIETLLPQPPWPSIPTITHGGNGAPTKILCGYLLCAETIFNPVLKALPKLIHVRPRSTALQELLAAGLNFTIAAAHEKSAIGAASESRLPELLLIECLRQYTDTLPDDEKGVLAALRDPVVAKVLGVLHGNPSRRWTLDALASEVGSSRPVIANRFKNLLGQSPIRYLTNWRLQMAARMLSDTQMPVSEIAFRVGYESEAAFSRAFKRRLGHAPTYWRLEPSAPGSNRVAATFD